MGLIMGTKVSFPDCSSSAAKTTETTSVGTPMASGSVAVSPPASIWFGSPGVAFTGNLPAVTLSPAENALAGTSPASATSTMAEPRSSMVVPYVSMKLLVAFSRTTSIPGNRLPMRSPPPIPGNRRRRPSFAKNPVHSSPRTSTKAPAPISETPMPLDVDASLRRDVWGKGVGQAHPATVLQGARSSQVGGSKLDSNACVEKTTRVR